METETKHWEAIAKYLKGELSERERHELSEWVHSHPDHKKVFEEVKNLWFATENEAEIAVDVDKNWERFRKSAVSSQRPPAIRLEPEVRNSGKQRSLWPVLFRAAAVLVVGFLIAYVFIRPQQLEEPIAYFTGEKEIKEFYLPDSSKVFLNGNSRLSYAADFNLQNRIVNLEGEAFFEVKKADGHRFIVYAKNSKTEVLGTSFVVSAYAAQPGVEVKVVSGKVAFSLHDESNTIFLEPGSKGVLEGETNEVEKAEIENENFLSWKEQRLQYENTRFAQVVKSLETHFGTTVQVNSPELLNCRYSGTFDQPEIERVLEVMSATMNFNFYQTGGSYIITGPGCN